MEIDWTTLLDRGPQIQATRVWRAYTLSFDCGKSRIGRAGGYSKVFGTCITRA